MTVVERLVEVAVFRDSEVRWVMQSCWPCRDGGNSFVDPVDLDAALDIVRELPAVFPVGPENVKYMDISDY